MKLLEVENKLQNKENFMLRIEANPNGDLQNKDLYLEISHTENQTKLLGFFIQKKNNNNEQLKSHDDYITKMLFTRTYPTTQNGGGVMRLLTEFFEYSYGITDNYIMERKIRIDNDEKIKQLKQENEQLKQENEQLKQENEQS